MLWKHVLYWLGAGVAGALLMVLMGGPLFFLEGGVEISRRSFSVAGPVFALSGLFLGVLLGIFRSVIKTARYQLLPFWIRGGLICGCVVLIYFLLLYRFFDLIYFLVVYGCFNYIGFLLGSGAEEIVLQCFILYVVGPIFPTVWFIVLAGSLFGDYGLFAEVYSPILSIPAWFIMGSLVGMVIGLFKNKKSPPLK